MFAPPSLNCVFLVLMMVLILLLPPHPSSPPSPSNPNVMNAAAWERLRCSKLSIQKEKKDNSNETRSSPRTAIKVLNTLGSDISQIKFK